MKVAINAGHCPGLDSGCVGSKITEAELTKSYAEQVKAYLEAAGIETLFIQDNELQNICDQANEFGADIFVSIHFNAAGSADAHGTETFYSDGSVNGQLLAGAIQKQLIDTLHTTDRGLKTDGLYVVRHTNMPAVLTEVGFLSNDAEQDLVMNNVDAASAAIARGITDYQLLVDHDDHTNENQPDAETEGMVSKYFSKDEVSCKCGCGFADVSEAELGLLDDLRERVGKPVYLSCAARCETHNADSSVGGVRGSQHTVCTAADVLVPDGWTVDQLADLAVELGADGVGRYYNSGFVHIDCRSGRQNAGYAWNDQE